MAAPLLQACVVASVGTALGVPLSWPQLVFAFLAAGTAAGAVPAPGGIGPVDAALVLTLAGYGTPLALATATVIGYRVLTVWLPLLPGMPACRRWCSGRRCEGRGRPVRPCQPSAGVSRSEMLLMQYRWSVGVA